MKTLHECLTDYDTTLLRAIAERRGAEVTTSQPREMAKEMAGALLEPDSVAEALTWLAAEERRALDALLASGGRMRAHRFAQRFGEIRRFGPGSLAREAPWRQPISPAEGLWYRALIARGFAEEAGTVVEFVFIPSDLIPLLPPARVPDAVFQVPPADQPDRMVPGDPACVDDLGTLLVMAQDRALRVSGEELDPRSTDALQQPFLVRGSARVGFLFHVAQSAGLLRLQGRAVHLDRDAVRSWLRLSRAQQLRALQDAWLADPTWNDLWHVSSIRCEATGWRNDPLLARQAVLDLLRRCASEAWLSIAGFVDAVHEHVPDYLRPNGDFESWYIRDARSGEYLTGFEHWDRIEGALLAYFVTGPLHWLGMLSLGYREGWEKPSSFRLTPWGAAFLDPSRSPPEELPAQAARVTPESVVFMPRQASLSDRFQLARIADWQASGEDYVYAITPASLGRTLSDGVQVERVERFLQRISEDQVPAAAIARIRTWAEGYGQVRLRRAALLETRNPQLMGELRAHERIRGYLREVLSPTTVLVREGDWDLLMQELYRAGYLPEIIDR
jgi:hypothetical protein